MLVLRPKLMPFLSAQQPIHLSSHKIQDLLPNGTKIKDDYIFLSKCRMKRFATVVHKLQKMEDWLTQYVVLIKGFHYTSTTGLDGDGCQVAVSSSFE